MICNLRGNPNSLKLNEHKDDPYTQRWLWTKFKYDCEIFVPSLISEFNEEGNEELIALYNSLRHAQQWATFKPIPEPWINFFGAKPIHLEDLIFWTSELVSEERFRLRSESLCILLDTSESQLCNRRIRGEFLDFTREIFENSLGVWCIRQAIKPDKKCYNLK